MYETTCYLCYARIVDPRAHRAWHILEGNDVSADQQTKISEKVKEMIAEDRFKHTGIRP